MRLILSTILTTLTTALATFSMTSHLQALSFSSLEPALISEIGISAFTAVENFRGIPDGHTNDNFGIYAGFELASPVPGLNQYGLGAQFAAGCGTYNFAGHRQNYSRNRKVQCQEFMTAGLFLPPIPSLPLSMGVVYDWMFNQNYGLYIQNMTLQQIRGQMAYFVTSADELGVWATYDTSRERKNHNLHALGFQVNYRSIAQINFFWRHLYGSGVESVLSLGTPIRSRLNRENSSLPGKYIVGLELNVPFFKSWMLSGKACYMHPGTRSGYLGSQEYVSNIAIHLNYYFGGNPNTTENCTWMPYMSIANNTNFFVDVTTKYKHRRKPISFK